MTEGLILYSGGFDSVALLHKLILSKEFDELTVLYENSEQMCGEHERTKAKEVFNLFKKKYSKKYGTKLIWKQEDIDLGWMSKEIFGREALLLLHLTTILRHGEHINFYLGWHKSNIKDLDISKKVFKWVKKNSSDKVNFWFIEDYFNGNDEYQIKASVIKYLLDNNLFALPNSSSLQQTTEEFEKRKHWFENNPKEREVATALIDIEVFTSLDLSKIFKFKTKEQIQELYNKKTIKKEN